VLPRGHTADLLRPRSAWWAWWRNSPRASGSPADARCRGPGVWWFILDQDSPGGKLGLGLVSAIYRLIAPGHVFTNSASTNQKPPSTPVVHRIYGF